MEGEASLLIEALQLTLQPHYFGHKAPFHVFQGSYNTKKGTGIEEGGDIQSHRISLITNGKDPVYGCDNVGTVPAALATYLAVEALHPDLVINCGTAGGFSKQGFGMNGEDEEAEEGEKGAKIADIFLSTKFVNHDRRIPLPGFTEYGIGSHTPTPVPNLLKHLQQTLNFSLQSEDTGDNGNGKLVGGNRVKSGVVTTGNSLDHVEADDQIMKQCNASVKDMEGAAIAWCCSLLQVPYFAVKVVTDIVDGGQPTADEFMANFAKAQKTLKEVMPLVLDFCIGKTVSEL